MWLDTSLSESSAIRCHSSSSICAGRLSEDPMGCTDSRRTRLVTQCEPCTVASEMLKACLLVQNDLITADGGEMTTDCEEAWQCKPEYPRVATGSCDLCSLAGSPKSSLVLFFVHCFRPPHSLSDKKLSNISCHYPFLFRIHLHYAQAQRFTITLSRMFKNVLLALTILALALAAASSAASNTNTRHRSTLSVSLLLVLLSHTVTD